MSRYIEVVGHFSDESGLNIVLWPPTSHTNHEINALIEDYLMKNKMTTELDLWKKQELSINYQFGWGRLSEEDFWRKQGFSEEEVYYYIHGFEEE